MFHQIIGFKKIVNYWIPTLKWWIDLKQEALGFFVPLACNFLKF